jgi:ketosteroid isomerase-like protein
MSETEQANLAAIRAYLAALESGNPGPTLRGFFTEDVLQIELPNRLNPNGKQSDLATMLQRSQQGTKVLSLQSYQIVSEITQGSRVAVEAKWTGVLAVPFGTLQPGSEMTAHFAMFFEMREGKIALQRNYDCFEPW